VPEATVAPARALRAVGLGPRELRALSRRDDAHGLALLTAHAALLALTGFAVWRSLGTLWLVPAVVVHGVVLAHLFAPLHECAHRTAFRRRWLADAVGTACGFLVGPPLRAFRAEHVAHHAFTQDAERDPELIPLPASLGAYAWFVVGGPYWRYLVGSTLAHAAGHFGPGDSYLRADDRPGIVREARLVVAAWLVVAALSWWTGSTAVLWLWLVPRLVGEPIMRVARLSEHAGRPRTSDPRVGTRSLRVGLPLRLLAWNMPYHAEHHAAPGVPFHALPALHARFGPEVEGRPGGYLAAHADIVRRIRSGEGPGIA
jgi:fatty acid desaturase